MFCFPCMTGRCGHPQHRIPHAQVDAVTACQGTLMCEDCAVREASFLPDPEET